MWYAIVRDSDGTLLSTGTVVGDLPAGVIAIALGDALPAGVWDPQQRAFVPAQPQPAEQRITRLAFRNRFTMPEKIAIEFAAADDATAPPQRRQFAAMLRIWMRDVDTATSVDLSHAVTRSGVEALEANGLIAAGRAAAILDGPIADDERVA